MKRNFRQDASTPTDDFDVEPADPDPEEIDYSKRNKTKISISVNSLTNAKPVTECGCGNCPDIVDPLYDGAESDLISEFYALNSCDSPRSMTIKRAKEAYIKYQGALFHSDEHTSAYERHRYGIYPRILNADRYFRNNFQGLTTVMFTRRIDPTDENGNWIEPATLDTMLHNDRVMRRIREASRYKLKRMKNLDFEYVRITAPTESTATPHEHRYFWIEDPDNQVTLDDFRHVMNKHLEYCANAKEDDHPIIPDERDAVIIEHDPPLVNSELAREDTRHTLGVQYLGSQLAHQPLGDKFNSSAEDPKETLLEGGAIGWVTPSRWFGASNGVPKLNDR